MARLTTRPSLTTPDGNCKWRRIGNLLTEGKRTPQSDRHCVVSDKVGHVTPGSPVVSDYAGGMPDSEALRSRRHRAHQRGDHRECGPKCAARRAAARAAEPVVETVSQAVEAFCAAVAGWPESDPRRVELALCRVWARMLDEREGDAFRIGEALAMHMKTLSIEPERPADVIDEIRARGAAREIERLAMHARGESSPVRPAQHWVNGPPAS